ncbi:MAG: hypothetical protein ABW123_06130 [Cystobacter sp.]
MGRRSILTKELRDEFCSLVTTTLTFEDCCRSLRIAESTFYLWMEKGREGREALERGEKLVHGQKKFVRFLDAVEDAKAMAKERLISVIAQGAEDNPEDAKWLLIKRYPAEFGDNTKVTIEGELNAALDKLEEQLPRETFILVARVLAGQPGPRKSPKAPGGHGDAGGSGAPPGVDSGGNPGLPAAPPPAAANQRPAENHQGGEGPHRRPHAPAPWED